MRLSQRRLQVILAIILATVFRVVILELDKMNCRGSQVEFLCDMNFFVLEGLLVVLLLVLVIPNMILSDKRDQIARFATILLIPAVANALLRIVDFMRFDCLGVGLDNDESVCLVLLLQLILLSIPTLASVIFLGLKGWKLLFLKESTL